VIRGVIHFLLLESLEQYYQAVGRAGRDGRPAFGILLYSPVNAKVRRDMIRQSACSAEQVRKVWTGYCQAGRAALRTINPWTEFQNMDEEHAVCAENFTRIDQGRIASPWQAVIALVCFAVPVTSRGYLCSGLVV
jgi:superfamily II DNA helicase RecQ